MRGITGCVLFQKALTLTLSRKVVAGADLFVLRDASADAGPTGGAQSQLRGASRFSSPHHVSQLGHETRSYSPRPNSARPGVICVCKEKQSCSNIQHT